jgi:NHLM bacteriocin system ABC transporter ATP-binding protein
MTQTAQWLAGNQAIALNAATPPGTLVSGSAEVFAVDRATGERLNLFSIEPGEPILPIVNSVAMDWDLLAITLETSCVEPAGEAPEWAVIFALENWLAKIGSALALFRNAGEVEPVRRGALLLTAGQRIAAEQGLEFVRLDSGAGLLAGAPVEPGVTVALVPGICLESCGESEWTAIADGGADSLKKTLDLAIAVFLTALREDRARREADEKQRFTLRQIVSERGLLNAVGALAGFTLRRSHLGEARENPLEGARHAVLDELGMPYESREIRVRGVLLSGDWWRRENGPLVAWRKDGSPVALLSGGILFDPHTHVRTRINARVAAELHSFAQMIYRPLPENFFGWLMRARRRDLRTIVLGAAGAALMAFVPPQGAAILIGQAIPDANQNMVLQVAFGMVAAALGAAGFLLAQAIATLRVQTAAFQVVQAGIWDQLLKLSPSFYRRFTVGQLRARADSATRAFQLMTADALRTLFSGIASFSILLLMLFYSAGLAGIALIAGLIVMGSTWLGARALYRVQSEWKDKDEALSGLVLQAINAVSKLRVAGARDRAFAQWAAEYSEKQTLNRKIRGIRDNVRVVNILIPPLASAAGFIYLLSSTIPLAAFLACNASLALFLAALTSASDTTAGLVVVANLWKRFGVILQATPEVNARKAHPGRLRGEIALENITFRYRDDGPLILNGVSVYAKPGECIAITGPSGGGKSTLLNLLLRFEIPHSGAIGLDGREISNLDITEVRRQIGVVTQDGRVMAGSVFDNICTGATHTMDEAWAAARDAGLAEDIENMPMGMYTIVSEGGSNLSGGQRQRLLIARALVLRPSILIFDEATSALDNRTQKIVTESLKRLKATRILVAHRLSTIREADRIYVIEKGRVVQEGTYRQLSATGGRFAQLVSRQTA